MSMWSSLKEFERFLFFFFFFQTQISRLYLISLSAINGKPLRQPFLNQRLWNKCVPFRRGKRRKMPKEIGLKSMQFPAFRVCGQRELLGVFTFLSLIYCESPQAEGGKWWSLHLSSHQCVSAYVFLRSKKQD